MSATKVVRVIALIATA